MEEPTQSESESEVASDSANPWTVAYHTPLSMAFSRQEYWSGLPFPFPGDLPDPGIEPRFPAVQKILYQLSHQGSPMNLWDDTIQVLTVNKVLP